MRFTRVVGVAFPLALSECGVSVLSEVGDSSAIVFGMFGGWPYSWMRLCGREESRRRSM